MANANLDALVEEARAAIEAANSPDDLTRVRAGYLGRKGSIAGVLRGIGNLPPAERSGVGEAANTAKRRVEALADARRAELDQHATLDSLEKHRLDVTLPGAAPAAGCHRCRSPRRPERTR